MSSNRNKPYYQALLEQTYALSVKGYGMRMFQKTWPALKRVDFKSRIAGFIVVPMSAISVSDLLLIKRHPLYGGLALSIRSEYISVVVGNLRVTEVTSLPDGSVIDTPLVSDVVPLAILGKVIPYSMEMLYVDDRRALESYSQACTLRDVLPFNGHGGVN